MDNYGYGNSGYVGVPLGVGIALSDKEYISGGEARLSEAKKEDIILKCKDARTDYEIEKIMDTIPLDETFEELLQLRERIR